MNSFSRLARFHRYSRLTSAMAIGLAVAFIPQTVSAQSETCGAAVSQLQAYAQQVNAIAQGELQQGIPMRCGYNGYCAQALLQQLSVWYAQQSSMVNQWYMTIANQCSAAPVQRRAAGRKKQTRPDDDIDVDDLTVDDEDKTVRIRIPSTPSGYSRSRR